MSKQYNVTSTMDELKHKFRDLLNKHQVFNSFQLLAFPKSIELLI